MPTKPHPSTVALYLRVSASDQAFASQLEAIRGYCRRRGWRQVRIFKEKVSGASSARTVLDQLMQAARAGEITTLVVFKLDRLGRSLAHLTQIVAELARLKIALVATSEGIDTGINDAETQLKINMLGTFAQYNREQIRARCDYGRRAARRRGVHLGRPAMPQETIDKIVSLRTKFKRIKRRKWTEEPMTFAAIGQLAGVSAATACRVWNAYQKTNGKT